MMNSESSKSDKVRERVRTEERHQLALELHDSIGQVLALAKLQLVRIEQTVRGPVDPGARAWLQTTVASLIPEIDTAMQAVQNAVFSLNDTGLTQTGLLAALEQACHAFSRRTGIPCQGRFEPLDLDGERGQLVVLIVREALWNIARHSGATKTEVALHGCADHGILSVSDNGVGIDATHLSASRSIGLQGMQERARALGGKLTADSTPKRGTHLTVSFPLDLRHQNTSLPY